MLFYGFINNTHIALTLLSIIRFNVPGLFRELQLKVGKIQVCSRTRPFLLYSMLHGVLTGIQATYKFMEVSMNKILKIAVLSLATVGLGVKAETETFDELFNTEKTDQYVFSTHAGSQYTFKYKYDDVISVCSTSQNDGYGVFTYMVFADRSTSFDVGFEFIDGKYTAGHQSQCNRYQEHYPVDVSDIETWKADQIAVRTKYGVNSYPTAETLDKKISDRVTYENNYELEVEEQAVGDIYRISNATTELLGCRIETTNYTYPLYLLILPDNMQTFQVLASSDGSSNIKIKNCQTFPLTGEITLYALKQFLTD